MYEYRATVWKWADGDSVTLDVDLGFHIRQQMKMRLAGIDTAEMNSPDDVLRARAKAATAYVNRAMPPGWPCIIRSEKPWAQEKWGRWLCWIYPISAGPAVPLSLNEMLVNEGLAKPYEGGAR